MSAIHTPYIQGLGTIEGRWLTLLNPATLLEDDTEALAVSAPPILDPPSDGEPRIMPAEPPPRKHSWRDKVSRQPSEIEAPEVTLQSVLDSESIQELEQMAKALSEGDFYRQMSSKIQGELQSLAAYISRTMANLRLLEPSIRLSVEQDMAAASEQLSAVVKSTEEAANTIISLTETLLDHQASLGEALEKLKRQKYRGRDQHQVIDQLDRLRQEDEKTLIEILTSLSFQDLTGQRIQAIVTMVTTVQAKLFDLIRAFGIKVHAEENDPTQDASAAASAREEGKLAQDSVDSLLSQMFK
jgi:chemotaxis protein CheZ